MKQFSNILILAIVMLTSIPHAFAQDEDAGKKLKSIQVAYIAKNLNLTPEEAEKFWPVYNNYRTEMDQLIADKERNKAIDTKSTRSADADAIARSNMDKDLSYDKRFLDIKTKYTAEFQRVLPASKASAVFNSEKEFRRIMIKHLQNSQQINRLNNQQLRPRH
ncbi:MAG: hypothetical protein JO154_21575 [Chitinophaga sp.]|uniref:hypothetical protein n=1 Tax=Chitinophaga sp. TaxID=1869181 RepID=UPI0025BFC618|nr:hypothetical protein [Chitinophaga sp.]MBV8255207.1 hypothetical protein [Chitinophaga sp.]